MVEIHRRLAAAYGPLGGPERRDPLEELIVTVLSQNTSDLNRDRAFAALRARWPSWEGLSGASEPELIETIRVGGIANTKGPRILSILREIREREGGSLDLSWMRRAHSDRVSAYLSSLPGVGPKTVACVLAFSLARPVLPVDTHVGRVGRRLGFIPERASTERAHQAMEELVPAGLRVQTHVGMIRLGRKICRPARPLCRVCPVGDLCPSFPLFTGRGTQAARSSSAGPSSCSGAGAVRAGSSRGRSL